MISSGKELFAIVAPMEQSAIRDGRSIGEIVPDFACASSGLASVGETSLLRRGRLAVALVDIIDHQCLEVSGDRGAAQGAELLAIDEHGCGRRFAGAGQRDADI